MPKPNIKDLIKKLQAQHNSTVASNKEFELQQSFKTPVAEGPVKWQQVLPEEMLGLKLGDLLGDSRYVFNFVYEGRKYYVCTHKKDYDAIKMKYPVGVAINLSDIIGLFSGTFHVAEAGGFAERTAGPLLNLMRIIPGIKIIGTVNIV